MQNREQMGAWQIFVGLFCQVRFPSRHRSHREFQNIAAFKHFPSPRCWRVQVGVVTFGVLQRAHLETIWKGDKSFRLTRHAGGLIKWARPRVSRHKAADPATLRGREGKRESEKTARDLRSHVSGCCWNRRSWPTSVGHRFSLAFAVFFFSFSFGLVFLCGMDCGHCSRGCRSKWR